MRREISGFRVAHGEIFLVRAHGELDDLARQVEESRVHVAKDDHRPFSKTGHFFEQALVFDQFQASLGADLVGLFLNQQAAVFARQHDRAFLLQLCAVLVQGRDSERTAPLDAVAFGFIAGFEAINLELDGLAVENADNSLERAHPAQLSASPAHGFRPVESAHDLRHEFCNDVFQRTTRNFAHGDVEVALFRVAPHFGLIDRGKACPAQEALHSLFRRADLWAFFLFADISRFLWQTVNCNGEAARAGQGRHFTELNAGFGQAPGQRVAQIAFGLCLHACRNLFRKEFEEKFSHDVEIVLCFVSA